MPLVDPQSWQVLPFGDRNAFVDFLGQHGLWHEQFNAMVRRLGGPPFPTMPLGDGPVEEGGDWHLAHQAVHEGSASGLGLSAPPDFTAYDLNHADEFSTYMWAHAAEHLRLRDAV